jgi:hypothetical protein
MANEEHVALLEQGVDVWNKWRRENPDVCPDLSGKNFANKNFEKANFRCTNFAGATLIEADFSGADLEGADLHRADLTKADLGEAYVVYADLSGAILSRADLTETNFRAAKLIGADLTNADLKFAILVHANCSHADFTGCQIYGTSAWDVTLDQSVQKQLLITDYNQSRITVDNIEVAQFVYLLLHNEKIRHVIDTVTSKAVLILGRFTKKRKKALDALREELRKREYVPILFDFEKPRSGTTDETITLLARMVRFVIADISDAKSVLQELRAIIPDLPSVPVQPLIVRQQDKPGMFDFYNPRLRPSVLEPYRYDSLDHLLANLNERVIRPAELKALELRGAKPE